MFDIHTIFALQNGVPAFLTDASAFRSLFPASLSDETVTTWRERLAAAPPIVRDILAGRVVEQKSPWIIVNLAEEALEQPILGEVGEVSAEGVEYFQHVQTQEVQVNIVASNAEIARALHYVIRGVMLTASHDFIRAGYENLEYLGTDGLHPMEESIAIELGLFMLTQRYRARSVFSAAKPSAPALPAKGWFVQFAGVEVDPAWPVEDGTLEGQPFPAPGAGTPGGVVSE